MGQEQILIAGLLVAVATLSALARVLSIPYPIVLVIGGAMVGLIPALPTVRLDPDVVLVVFLPPLLYIGAYFANFGDMRANLRGLTLNSVGLVLATMGAVALVAHAIVPGLPWAAAIALGAIVSPTDPLAAGLVMRRLGAPRRLVSNAEGEGLFNDATALLAYRMAVAALVGTAVPLRYAGPRFLMDAVGGVAVGIAVGWVIAFIRRRTTDAQVSVTISLLSGYAAFIPAAALGVSPVLAVVTTGIYMGIRGPSILPARTRLQGAMVWDILSFLINAILFVLIGLQLPSVLDGQSGRSAGTLAGYAFAVSGAVVATRLAWFFVGPYLRGLGPLARGPGPHAHPRPAERDQPAGPRQRLVLAWCGTRGAVSLAAALALPLTTDAGNPFPERDLIIFLTFAVIFVTLVVQGLTLPVLIRGLGIGADRTEADEELRARLAATGAALAQIDRLAERRWTREDTVARMRGAYEYRQRRLAARAGQIEDDDGYEYRSLAYQHMIHSVLQAQRRELIRLRDQGEISNEVLNRLVREFDLEESRLEI